MKYQLVIQFPENLYGDIEWIATIEDRLIEALDTAEVDGHDIGSGQVNIFIYTNDPVLIFDKVKFVLETEHIPLSDIKVAYRDVSAETYTCLWPEGLTSFIIV